MNTESLPLKEMGLMRPADPRESAYAALMAAADQLGTWTPEWGENLAMPYLECRDLVRAAYWDGVATELRATRCGRPSLHKVSLMECPSITSDQSKWCVRCKRLAEIAQALEP